MPDWVRSSKEVSRMIFMPAGDSYHPAFKVVSDVSTNEIDSVLNDGVG